MKYIIMAGGEYKDFETPKQLLKVCNEVIIERTIRLLKENGIKDIAISTNNPAFDYINVPKLKHKNTFVHEYKNEGSKGWWLDAFYPTNEPTCYIWGDVYFSEKAIKTIVEANTDDIELFGSIPPFAPNYPKKWVEPFALKVVNNEHLWSSIKKTKEYALEGKTLRKNPIIWELWTVIKDMPLETEYGKYIYNYTAINDYTSDIDGLLDTSILEYILGEGGNMVRVEVIEEFTLGQFKLLKNIERNNPNKKEEGRLYVRDKFECDENMAKYLTGDNKYNTPYVKIIEIIPEQVSEEKPIEVEELPTTQVDEEAKKFDEVKPKPKKAKRKK